jgi:hypothetical protein
LRALLVRQLVGGNRHDLHQGRAADPLSEAPGARLEIAVPGLSKANAQRPSQPVWDVLAEGMAAVEALPQAGRIGREKPLGAGTPKPLGEIGRLLERTPIFEATTLALPPQIAQGARPSAQQKRAGSKGQVRLRAGYGGGERVMVTGATGNDNPYFGALWDLETARPGQVYLFATGYGKGARYDQLREQGGERVTVLPESITVEGGGGAGGGDAGDGPRLSYP